MVEGKAIEVSEREDKRNWADDDVRCKPRYQASKASPPVWSVDSKRRRGGQEYHLGSLPSEIFGMRMRAWHVRRV